MEPPAVCVEQPGYGTAEIVIYNTGMTIKSPIDRALPFICQTIMSKSQAINTT